MTDGSWQAPGNPGSWYIPAPDRPHSPRWILGPQASKRCPLTQFPMGNLWTQGSSCAQQQAEYHCLRLSTHPNTQLPNDSSRRPVHGHHQTANTKLLDKLTGEGWSQSVKTGRDAHVFKCTDTNARPKELLIIKETRHHYRKLIKFSGWKRMSIGKRL